MSAGSSGSPGTYIRCLSGAAESARWAMLAALGTWAGTPWPASPGMRSPAVRKEGREAEVELPSEAGPDTAHAARRQEWMHAVHGLPSKPPTAAPRGTHEEGEEALLEHQLAELLPLAHAGVHACRGRQPGCTRVSWDARTAERLPRRRRALESTHCREQAGDSPASSAPVGLWAHACSSTTLPAGALLKVSIMPSKSRPRVSGL